MSWSDVERVASLVAERNAVDAEVGRTTGRPVVAGHLGEWIASQIFDITLEHSAVAKGIDGRFASGPLAGRSVNVKWYGKQEGMLDLQEETDADYYLVMTGPKGAAVSSRGGTRPLCISAVYLFAIPELIAVLRERGVRIGIATSVRVGDWDAAEIYPRQANHALSVSDEQRGLLALFAGEEPGGDPQKSDPVDIPPSADDRSAALAELFHEIYQRATPPSTQSSSGAASSLAWSSPRSS